MREADKDAKHLIAEQIARENMKVKSVVGGKQSVHHVVDKQYKKGLRLESLFDPDETKRIK